MNKFNEISLRTKTISERSQRGYKIYTDKNNFQLVEATTVAEAMEKSGIKNPVKIEVAGVITRSLFGKSELAEMQSAQAVEAPATPPTSTPA